MLLLALALACSDPPPAAPTPPASGPAPAAPAAAKAPAQTVPDAAAIPATWEVRGSNGGSLLQLWPTASGVHARLVGGAHDDGVGGTPTECTVDLDGSPAVDRFTAAGASGASVEVAFEGKDRARVTAKPGGSCPDSASFDGPYFRSTASRDPMALCRPGEAPYFACTTAKGWHVALCGGADPATKDLTLQYRFGKPGDERLAWPAGGAAPDVSFRRFAETHASATSRGVTFDNGGYTYRIFVQEGRDGGAGVTVEKEGKVASTHACVERGRVEQLERLDGVLPAG
jgi:hypothetical protein